jgi:hypothetical protein
MKLSALCTTLAVMAFGLISMPAHADGGVEIVHYRCEPEAHRLYVGTAVSYEITSDFGKDIIPLNQPLPPEQRKLECQLSATNEVNVQIGQNVENPRNDNVIVKINGKYLDDMTFDPNQEFSYVISQQNPNKNLIIQYSNKIIKSKVWGWPSSDSK